MATHAGATPAPRQRQRPRPAANRFFKTATTAKAARQAAARMEAIAAVAEEAREAREEAAASGPPPKRPPGRPRKLAPGLLALAVAAVNPPWRALEQCRWDRVLIRYIQDRALIKQNLGPTVGGE
jgi:hypothetical protein